MCDKNNPPRQPEHGTIAVAPIEAYKVNNFSKPNGGTCSGCVTVDCHGGTCLLAQNRVYNENGHAIGHLIWVNEELYIKWKLLGN